MSEGLDLSMGAVVSLAGVVLATLLMNGRSLPAASAAAIGVGAAFGLANGVLVVGLGIPPFVATLGTLGIAQGLALVADGRPERRRRRRRSSRPLRQPAAGSPVLYRDRGDRVSGVLFYVPSDPLGLLCLGDWRQSRVARAGGRERDRYHVGIYVLAGVMAGVAALLLTGRMSAGHPTAAIGMEFDASRRSSSAEHRSSAGRAAWSAPSSASSRSAC